MALYKIDKTTGDASLVSGGVNDGTLVKKAGDTMTGKLTVAVDNSVGLEISRSHSSTSTRTSSLAIGNNIPSGTAGSTSGAINIYGKGNKKVTLRTGIEDLTGNWTLYLPDKSGTIATKEEVDSVDTSVNNLYDFVTANYVKNHGDTMTGNLTINRQVGTDRTASRITLGNNIAEGTEKNSYGEIDIYGYGTNKIQIYAPTVTADRHLLLPDKGGTVATISDVENATKVDANVTPSSSGKSTLLAYVNDVIVPKQLGTYSFGASGFSDLPVNDWGYDVTVHRGGGTYVTIERQLSNGLIYSRGINSEGQWVGGWVKLTNSPEVVQLFTNSYIDIADTWLSVMNPGYTSIDDFDFIGLSWGIVDRNSSWNTIQVLTTASAFKNSSRSDPFVVIDDPFSPADSKRVMVAWAGDGLFGISVDVYRGNQVYQYQRLNVLGIRI